MQDSSLENILTNIGKMLEEGKELINEDSIIEFQINSKNMATQLAEIKKEGRLLKLGIVGEVKAGKSSFLNAMLFDGEDILPKAPTPMTAALTRISYSERPVAKIVFYEDYDWNGILEMSNKYDETLEKMYNDYCEKNNERSKNTNYLPLQRRKILSKEEFEKLHKEQIPKEYKACKEVLLLANEKEINVNEYLGTQKIIEQSGSDLQYLRELNDYVGSEGKFTAIVKYTEIQLNNKLLEGIEIIDTPGLNDPILSRSRVTQKFLIECDAVFLLGYCGQFLGSEDIGFIMSSLPNEGINKAVLIGSKMDSAILQYPTRNATFKEAYLGTKKNCEKQAYDNINNCIVNNYNGTLIKQIKDSLPPKCISSLAYSAAIKIRDGKKLNESEKLLISNFERRFKDYKNSIDLLIGLSNIPDVKEKVFSETKSQKNEIISKRIETITNSQIGKFLSLLEDIGNQARSNQNDLRKYDCEQLEEKLENLKERLDSVRILVKNLFDRASIDSSRAIADMVVEALIETSNHNDIEVNDLHETKHHSSTSGHLWWKKTDHWDEVIINHTAEINDAIQNINKYHIRSLQMINDRFRNLLKIDALKENLKDVVMGAFEESNKEFDENKILMPLDNALNKITIPQIEINVEIFEEMLNKELTGVVINGVVKNEKIPLLKKAQSKVMSAISKEVVNKIKEQGTKIENDLQKQASVFIDNIVNQLEENKQKLEIMIKDKKANLIKFDKFISNITEAKKSLIELEG